VEIVCAWGPLYREAVTLHRECARAILFFHMRFPSYAQSVSCFAPPPTRGPL
jgi:hypothetical protein